MSIWRKRPTIKQKNFIRKYKKWVNEGMSNLLEQLSEKDLKSYTYLNKIRERLWGEDSKSRVSVMVGAGFSKNASKIEPSFEGMALWNELKDRLIGELSHHDSIKNRDVLEIAQMYSDEYGRSALDEVLKAAIPDDNFEPDTLHTKLLDLPWTDIYTTNYDTLLERAKKNVFKRSYQVIYDVNDIPSSVQPRIVKLHGSFPANRPFIFTSKDYELYPENFSPFVNMVQQSIMETTFVLIGFSGDDPNFEKWITWVRSNLKEHMPKIYMIGFGEESKRIILESKGITLIDLKDIYETSSNPFYSLFDELFEFLTYKDKIEKLDWPHQVPSSIEKDNYPDNREDYPGWVILPYEIRKKYSKSFWRGSFDYLIGMEPKEIDVHTLTKLNDMVWYYDKFHIPISAGLYNWLDKVVSSMTEKWYLIVPVLLKLVREARLRVDHENFTKYKLICESQNLSKEDFHSLRYEIILSLLDTNDIDIIYETLDKWDVGTKELEWGIKKACLYTRLDNMEEAEYLFEEYLQTVRQLLSIKMDDFRLLSLESIILHHLNNINILYSAKDRLRSLSTKWCDSAKEFNGVLAGLKQYDESDLGFKKLEQFDRGKVKYSTTFNDSYNYTLNEAFALVQVKEQYNFSIVDENQYDIALKNLQHIYPEYALAKRIHKINKKGIEKLFTREYVFHMGENEKIALLKILKNALDDTIESLIDNKVALEIYSSIYMVLDTETKQHIDDKILKYIENSKLDDLLERDTLKNTISWIFDAKTPKEAEEFTRKIFSLSLKPQDYSDLSVYRRFFFEPVLELFRYGKKVEGLEIGVHQIEKLLNIFESSEDNSLVEAAFLRLIFLTMTSSLNLDYQKRFKRAFEVIKEENLEKLCNFIRKENLDNLVNGTDDLSKEEIGEFLDKKIPIFYKENSMSDGYSTIEYFKITKTFFSGFSQIDNNMQPDKEHYISWLDKFYEWWDSQKPAFLNEVQYINPMIPIEDLLLHPIIVLKNNIWGAIPLEYLREEDILRAKTISNEIMNVEASKAMLLIPSLQRICSNTPYDFKFTIENLSSPNLETSKYAILTLYDYSIFMYKDEITDEMDTITRELLNILKYATGERLHQAVVVLKDLVNIDLGLINDDLVAKLIIYLNNYLAVLVDNDSSISNREDFVLWGSHANLAAVLIVKQSVTVRDSLEEWRNYINEHSLPEVTSALIHFS